MTDFFQGFGSGMLGLLGLGGIYDPLSDARDNLAAAKDDTVRWEQLLANLRTQAETDENLKKYIDQKTALTAKTSEYYNTLLWAQFDNQSVFISLLGVLFVVIFFFGIL